MKRPSHLECQRVSEMMKIGFSKFNSWFVGQVTMKQPYTSSVKVERGTSFVFEVVFITVVVVIWVVVYYHVLLCLCSSKSPQSPASGPLLITESITSTPPAISCVKSKSEQLVTPPNLPSMVFASTPPCAHH